MKTARLREVVYLPKVTCLVTDTSRIRRPPTPAWRAAGHSFHRPVAPEAPRALTAGTSRSPGPSRLTRGRTPTTLTPQPWRVPQARPLRAPLEDRPLPSLAVALQMSAIRGQSRAVSGNTVLWRLPQGICREYQPHVTGAQGARQATAMPPGSAPVPPPTAFKKRLAEQKAGGLDDRPILARLVRVIPGQTLIKLLMVLALNPQSSRQKKNDLRARPTRNLQTGLGRLWPSPPSPHAICPCRLGASSSVMLWETGGLRERGAGSRIWGHTAVLSPTSPFPRAPEQRNPNCLA